MQQFLLSLIVIIGIFCNILGVSVVIKRQILSLGEAYCYAAILVFAIYSGAIQIFFFFSASQYFFFFELLFCMYSLYHIFRKFPISVFPLRKKFPLRPIEGILILMLITFILYLFLQALLLPPYNWDSMTYHLPRVFMFISEGNVFIKNFTNYPQTMYAWGYDILYFLFIRFNADYGLSVFNLICYTVILCGTYELVAKYYARFSLGFKSAFIVASLPSIILQATSTKNDLPCAAVTVVCFLAAFNFYRIRDGIHIYVLIVAVLFGITVKTVFGFFVAIFLCLYVPFLLRRIAFRDSFKKLYKLRLTAMPYSTLPLCQIVCLVVFWVHSNNLFNTIPGGYPEHFVSGHMNQDGLLGGFINISRYVLQSIDIPSQFGGNFLTLLHDALWGSNKTVALRNSLIWPAQLAGNLKPHEMFSWYGPLGAFLVIPALVYSAWRGRGFVRVVSLSLIAYAVFFAFSFVWMPWNGRFFVTVFGGSGLSLAFVMKKHIEKKFFTWMVFIIAGIMLIYTTLFNMNKPFLKLSKIHAQPFLFHWFDFVRDRNKYYDEHFQCKSILDAFINKIEPSKRILILGQSDSWLFPFFINRPDLTITAARPDSIYVNGSYYNSTVPEEYKEVKAMFDYVLYSEIPVGNQMDDVEEIICIDGKTIYNIPICLYNLSE